MPSARSPRSAASARRSSLPKRCSISVSWASDHLCSARPSQIGCSASCTMATWTSFEIRNGSSFTVSARYKAILVSDQAWSDWPNSNSAQARNWKRMAAFFMTELRQQYGGSELIVVVDVEADIRTLAGTAQFFQDEVVILQSPKHLSRRFVTGQRIGRGTRSLVRLSRQGNRPGGKVSHLPPASVRTVFGGKKWGVFQAQRVGAAEAVGIAPARLALLAGVGIKGKQGSQERGHGKVLRVRHRGRNVIFPIQLLSLGFQFVFIPFPGPFASPGFLSAHQGDEGD